MNKIKAQTVDALSGFSAQSKQLAMHRDSHTISKLKPRIRIIHIVAPEIIKTDVENFRDLVQRLTGKSSAQVKGRRKKACSVPPKGIISSSTNCPKLWTNIQPQDHQGIHILQGTQRIMKKEIQNLYNGPTGSSSHGMFGGYGNMNINLVQDLSEFTLLPFKSSQAQVKNLMFGEMPLC